MFAFTGSFWRRLVRSRPRKPSGGTAAHDRRVWVRHHAGLETTYRPAGAEDPTRFAAVVRDISVGGLSLTVDRALAPGELLAVELPGPTEEAGFSTLACVVHVNADGEGQWVVGCTFARELSDEDLAPFGARRTRPRKPSDQRTWNRYPCDVRASYRLAADPEDGPRPVKVLNISASGVGLLVDRPVDNGTLLSVDLCSPAGAAGKTMLSCVVHVSRQGEGEWALGCNFISELSEAELLALL
jgi:hypothetical protein